MFAELKREPAEGESAGGRSEAPSVRIFLAGLSSGSARLRFPEQEQHELLTVAGQAGIVAGR